MRRLAMRVYRYFTSAMLWSRVEPSEPLTWSSKIVYVNLYRVSYSAKRFRFWPKKSQEGRKRRRNMNTKYEYFIGQR